jgi:hypothetical protein
MERIGQTPHRTLHRLKDELATRGVIVSRNFRMVVSATRATAVKKRCERARVDRGLGEEANFFATEG